MGAGASRPELPPMCEKISRAQFQNKLMDIYAAYSLMSYYASIVRHADLEMNGRPPKQLEPSDIKNFDPEATQRIKKRAAKTDNEGEDFDLFMYFNQFAERYNNAEGDSARFQMLHEAIDKSGDVLQFYVGTLNDICENQDEKMYEEGPPSYNEKKGGLF